MVLASNRTVLRHRKWGVYYPAQSVWRDCKYTIFMCRVVHLSHPRCLSKRVCIIGAFYLGENRMSGWQLRGNGGGAGDPVPGSDLRAGLIPGAEIVPALFGTFHSSVHFLGVCNSPRVMSTTSSPMFAFHCKHLLLTKIFVSSSFFFFVGFFDIVGELLIFIRMSKGPGDGKWRRPHEPGRSRAGPDNIAALGAEIECLHKSGP